MRVLVGCEFTGVVRREFRLRGHNAWSCDLLPCEDNDPHHIQGDILTAISHTEWDMLIAFPPCTHLAISGARWFADKIEQQKEAIDFVRRLYLSDIPKIAIENPLGILSTHLRKPDQIIHPWQFGHPYKKATCLWLKGLPKLEPTKIMPTMYAKNGRIIDGRAPVVHWMGPSATRAMDRSRTFKGIARAMAKQWGSI